MTYKSAAALFFASILSFCFLLSPAHADTTDKQLNFGIISTESQINLKPIWEPFLKDMGKKLGVKVNAFFATDYAGIIQGMRFGKVDIAWLGNLSAVQAVDHANGQVFVQTVDAEGNPGYWSVLIVNKESPIHNVKEMLDKRHELNFGNGDPSSTSGYLVPAYYIFSKNGVSTKEFKHEVNANHETNALAVANKQVDVATNNTESLDRLKITSPSKYENIRVIWKSPLIPSDPIVWRKDLSADTKKKIYDFFLSYGDTPEENAVLKQLTWSKFRPSSDLQLIPIRELMIFKDIQTLTNNKNVNKNEKDKKLAELQAQLDDLTRLRAAINSMDASKNAKK